MKKLALHILIVSLLGGCIETEPSRGAEYAELEEQETLEAQQAIALELEQKSLTKADRESRELKLAAAELEYNQNPDDEMKIIWYGRRLAYLGRFQDAINVFTDGLTKFPESFKLLRHRGHRYLTTRQFDRAINDLQQAAFYAMDFPEFEIEPDGIPNSLNKPVRNSKFNIWYYLGLSYYMKGNYDKAVSSFRQCQKYANNNDLTVMTVNWLYASYAKLGNIEVADDLVQTIPWKMRLVENESRRYHDLIMLYGGHVTPNQLMVRNSADANVGYGIGNYYLLSGNRESAVSVFNRIIGTDQRDVIGYIAVEAELSNLNNTRPGL